MESPAENCAEIEAKIAAARDLNGIRHAREYPERVPPSLPPNGNTASGV